MSSEGELSSPSLPWRFGSTLTFGAVGALCKSFLNVACTTRVHGLDEFQKLLDERRDVSKRERGLITVANHLCVLDDPLMWGVLPMRSLLDPDNSRWSLGSADICFEHGHKSLLSLMFTLGQTLPTHRHTYSTYGGLYQPTITQCVRLLSRGPFMTKIQPPSSWGHFKRDNLSDPFSDVFTYSTTGTDSYPSPSAYGTRRHAWVHIFPEGRVHQHPEHRMRYFKWGIARLILESEPCPDVVPIFIEGTMNVMPEDRTVPRWVPKLGKTVEITFGKRIGQDVLDGFRERWRRIREKVGDEAASTNAEAIGLRIEVAGYIRGEVEKLRQQCGYPGDDPKSGSVETWIEEGDSSSGRKMDDSILGE